MLLIPIAIVEAEILIEIKILIIAKRISRKLNFIPILIFSAIYYCLAGVLSVIKIILPKIIAIESAFKTFLLKVTEIISVLNIILPKTTEIV
jgi:hypothetical protein